MPRAGRHRKNQPGQTCFGGRSQKRPTPDDWAYVYNFDEPYKPQAVNFPAGTAAEFAKDIDKLIETLSVSIPAILESDEYKAGQSIIHEKFKQHKEEYIKILQKKAKGKSVSLLHMPVGLVVAPVKNGEVLSPEAFDELPESEKNSCWKTSTKCRRKLKTPLRICLNGKINSARKPMICARSF